MDTQITSEVEAKKNGFTLIEILVVIGLIALLAAIVIVAVNPARQFAQGRDTQRTGNVDTVLNGIGQRISDNKGVFDGTGIDTKVCEVIVASGEAVPTVLNASNVNLTATVAAGKIFAQEIVTKDISGCIAAKTCYNLSCITPTYIGALPVEPKVTKANRDLGHTGYYVTREDFGTPQQGSQRITVFSIEGEPALNRADYISTSR